MSESAVESLAATPLDHPSEVMQCMEVWGGNEPVESTVSMPGLDAWVFSRPYLQADAGGDVYYASSCATGRIVRLLLADVSGHGSAVCDIAGQLRSLMRSQVNRLSQQSFVREMNRQFTALSESGCFATAIVNTFFSPTNRLTLCNAGHPAPLLFRARTAQWSLLKPIEESSDDHDGAIWNLPLGIEDMGEYEQFAIDMEKGDIVLCYSDSLTESKSPDGEFLGESGLLAVARTLRGDDVAGLIPRLLEGIGDLHAGNLKEDDVTVLMFRAKGAGVGPSFWRKLLGPFRFVRGLIRSFRNGEAMPLPDFSLSNLGGAIFGPLNRLWK
jgi:sigma-B regulation protein RsbU (phosphoserine phosphatase)